MAASADVKNKVEKLAATEAKAVSRAVRANSKENEAIYNAALEEGKKEERKRLKALKEKREMQGTIPSGKVISLDQRKAAKAALEAKYDAELSAFKDLEPKKHKKFEVGEKEFSEADVKAAGKAALEKADRESKKKAKLSKEAKSYQAIMAWTCTSAAALGVLRDRGGLFSSLPALVKSADGVKHPANDDIIIAVVAYGAASIVTNAKIKKGLFSIAIAAGNNAARIFGSRIESLDSAMAKVKEKLRIAA